MKTAKEVCACAADLVGGDRAAQHGDKIENFTRIATIWNGTLDAMGIETSRLLDAHDVAGLMEAMKIARRYSGSFNPDDYVDGAGYAGVAYEIRWRGVGVPPYVDAPDGA
jgi:hypothetical protein